MATAPLKVRCRRCKRGAEPLRRRHISRRRGDIEQGAVEVEKKGDFGRIVDLQTQRFDILLRLQIMFALCTYHRVLARTEGG